MTNSGSRGRGGSSEERQLEGHFPEPRDQAEGSRWPPARPHARRARRWSRPVAIALVALVAFGVGCSERRDPGRHNVIVISIDALRADRLGAYGYDRDTSPHLDAFAARGALFETVVAETSWTLPSPRHHAVGTLPVLARRGADPP